MSSLRYMAGEGYDVIITSGGLGPTADDLTAEVVGQFAGREMVLDPELEERIAEILRPLMRRWPGLDEDAIRASNRKQAVIPDGATVLEPVGTAPGLVVPAAGLRARPWWCFPGPPRELQPMWAAATATEAFQAAIAGAVSYERGIIRLFGIPESEIANTLRAAEAAGLELAALEITTCLRRGRDRGGDPVRAGRDAGVRARSWRSWVRRHADTLFSLDGSTVDEQVAMLLVSRGGGVAVAESCTGGLMAARLTDRAGSSEYFHGGVVAYSNEAKVRSCRRRRGC